MKIRSYIRPSVILCTMMIIMAAFLAAGCDGKEKNIKCKRGNDEAPTYRFVSTYKSEKITEEDLGDIRTDGEFVSCDPDNMLSYMGYYQGLDYVTLVFGKDSPLTLQNVEMYATQETVLPLTVDGILFREADGKKYITFKFETKYYDSEGGQEQWDAVQRTRYFRLPVSEEEPMSFYFINTKGSGNWNRESDACVGRCIQKEIIDQSYWTDYKYDKECEYYSADQKIWEYEITEDIITNNMPLE